jgi:hypothetical protein
MTLFTELSRLTGFWWEELDGKRQLVRPTPRCRDNIKINLQEMGWAGVA